MNVLLVHNHLASFVQTDIDLLKTAHNLRANEFRHRPSRLLRTLSKLWQDIEWSRVVISWFGGFHAFVAGSMATLLRKPHIIIASGYDVADIPEINYGNMRPGLRRQIGRFAFRRADLILPVSSFTAGELQKNVGSFGAKVRVVPHGFGMEHLDPVTSKRDRVVMIAGLDPGTRVLKGVHVLVGAARSMPETDFVLIGGSSDGSTGRLRSEAPPNLTLTGYVENAYKSDWLVQSKVYAQLSRYESFGCGLAEAMLQGCVPVVTDRASLPEVAGDSGFYAKYGDVDSTVRAIRQALATPEDYGLRARRRIMTEFPLENRRQKLLDAVQAVCMAK